MIKFGTDGWRGVISDDYTFANVRLVAQGIADYITSLGEADRGVVIGYDARFLSGRYAQAAAEVLAAAGVKTALSSCICPTPALTWQVKDRCAGGGVMITASHNPCEYNGLKFKADYGGSASPEIVQSMEKFVHQREQQRWTYTPPAAPPQYETFAPQTPYLDHVRAMLRPELLAKVPGRVVFDVMHGAAAGYPAKLAQDYGLDLEEVRSEFNPSFGGVPPEPIEKNLAALRRAVAERGAVVGLATDGDGDRIGAIDQDGRFINAHQIMALLTQYLVEKRGWTGGVAQTLTVSELVKRVAHKYGLKLYETPVGFKYIAELMLSQDILIGGEESGGIGIKHYIPERDGVLLGFLLLEMIAAYGRTLGQLLDAMMDEVGHFYYGREDLHLPEEQKQRLLRTLRDNPPTSLHGFTVKRADCTDGCKLYLPNGWVMFRASGTEPIVRIYAEADAPDKLSMILTQSVAYARKA